MGISVTQLLIILAIVALVFGTKRLRNIGTDLGAAIKGFKKGMQDEDGDLPKLEQEEQSQQKTQDKVQEKATEKQD